ncbi:MAG: EAL and GGDEF domain-containing protein [Deltaproteobacteria bacterium]|nr:EAL and GGDEF domain-containing protein [Deltaproteobacteria bacterium]
MYELKETSGHGMRETGVIYEVMESTVEPELRTPPGPGIDRGANAAKFIESLKIRPHFHPVVDLFSASVLGFEVLSRGVPPMTMPRDMFDEAKRLGVTWELEMACRVSAFREISAMPDEFRSHLYFINVSPDVFNDPRLVERFTLSRLKDFGVDPRQLVIEITEEKLFDCFVQFGSLVAHYTNQGFKIALDDFGAGYSGLINLVASTPHYLKLDMAIVREVHKHDYKQKLVKAITALASSVNARLIAEGVECMEELEVLIRHGVRYVQGYIFGRPEPAPYVLSEAWKKTLRSVVEKYDVTTVDMDERVAGMVIRPITIAKDTMCCRDLDLMIKKRTDLDHVIIIDHGNVVGLITRQAFYAETGGAFGYQLFQKKPIEVICKRNPLIVDDRMTVTMMAKLAMGRMQDDLYDPVLVVDAQGAFLGTVTVKQLVTKSVELEVRSAMGVNPLTNLPGNNVIHRWIQDALTSTEYTIIYADLDQFKGYNDTYGFLMGDEMLRFTAETIATWLEKLPVRGRLGHIGGDDFVIVLKGILEEEHLTALCRSYDEQKLVLFKNNDISRGYIEAADRLGNMVRMALVTMSMAVIDSCRGWNDPHPALFSEVAASLKKKVKRITAESCKSAYLCERRLHA